MAPRFNNPFPQFFDSTPTVYSGGALHFYAAGTSTPLDTYSDAALLTANTNPVVLNSAGRSAVDIYLQDLAYKVVLKDADGSTIWTADNFTGRDEKLVAKTLTGSGSPTGVVAGTAGSASILPDFYWDYTNSILYVCTTTGTALTAVWTAVNASASTPAVPTPQGRLTLTSGTPVLAADVVAGTAVYYTPHTGVLVPIYNGSSMTPTEFAELTLTLSASHTANSIYDVFVFSNSGVLTLATGPSWTTVTAGSGARGTGAGTTQLTRVKGLWTNAVSMTGRNGATTYTIGANLGTYVGSISMDGTNGQVSCLLAWGQSRKWAVWNAYNRVPITLKAGDSTGTWTDNGAAFRASNNSASNRADAFCGLADEMITATFHQRIFVAVTHTAQIGVGWNSTTAASGMNGTVSAGASTDVTATITAKHINPPSLGVNRVTSLEKMAALVDTVYGAEGGMMLLVEWNG